MKPKNELDGKFHTEITDNTMRCRIRFKDRKMEFDINELECNKLSGTKEPHRVSGIRVNFDKMEIQRNGKTIQQVDGGKNRDFHLIPPVRKVPNPVSWFPWIVPVPYPIPTWRRAKDVLNYNMQCHNSLIGSEKFNASVFGDREKLNFNVREEPFNDPNQDPSTRYVRDRLFDLCTDKGKKCPPALYLSDPLKVIELHCNPQTGDCEEEIVFTSKTGWSCQVTDYAQHGIRATAGRILPFKTGYESRLKCDSSLRHIFQTQAATVCDQRET